MSREVLRELELHSSTPPELGEFGAKLLMTSLPGLAASLAAGGGGMARAAADCRQAPVNHEKMDARQQAARFLPSDVSCIHPASAPCDNHGDSSTGARPLARQDSTP